MVEPITLIVGIATVINLFSTGFNWVKKLISTDELSSSSTISSHLATYSPIIYPSFMMEDTASTFIKNIMNSVAKYSFFVINLHRK